MRLPATLLLVLAAAGGCASPSAMETAGDAGPEAVPTFDRFGAVRRDLVTGAPVWAAPAAEMEARAPRFAADGSVARDPETGAPLYEERRGGVVARVLVTLR